MDQSLRDRIVLLLISGMSAEAAEAYCLKHGKDLDEARRSAASAEADCVAADTVVYPAG